MGATGVEMFAGTVRVGGDGGRPFQEILRDRAADRSQVAVRCFPAAEISYVALFTFRPERDVLRIKGKFAGCDDRRLL